MVDKIPHTPAGDSPDPGDRKPLAFQGWRVTVRQAFRDAVRYQQALPQTRAAADQIALYRHVARTLGLVDSTGSGESPAATASNKTPADLREFSEGGGKDPAPSMVAPGGSVTLVALRVSSGIWDLGSGIRQVTGRTTLAPADLVTVINALPDAVYCGERDGHGCGPVLAAVTAYRALARQLAGGR
jgi:hypothetical protein